MALAVAVKLALVDPAETCTDTGTEITELALLESPTTAPPAGAAPERFTVQAVVPEAASVVEAHCTEVRVAAGVTDSVAVRVTPLCTPVTTGD